MMQEFPDLLPEKPSFRTIVSEEPRIRELSLRAAQHGQTPFRELERRAHQRTAYPRLIPLTPLRDDDKSPQGPPIHVVGKHLSPLGLDFFHHEPIPQRYAVASLELASNGWVHFVMKITWCRFLKSNWYDSGGRFLRVVEWCNDEFTDFVRNPWRKSS